MADTNPKSAKSGNGNRKKVAGAPHWGRPLPGVKFGPWVEVYSNNAGCDYERIGHDQEGDTVKQSHTELHKIAAKPAVGKLKQVAKNIIRGNRKSNWLGPQNPQGEWIKDITMVRDQPTTVTTDLGHKFARTETGWVDIGKKYFPDHPDYAWRKYTG